MRFLVAAVGVLALLVAGCGSEEAAPAEGRTVTRVVTVAQAPPETTAESSSEAPPERAASPEPPETPEPGADLSGLLAEEGGGGAYKTVSDGTGALSVDVPVGWEHLVGEDPVWSEFGGVKTAIAAASDLEAWYAGGVTRGTDVGASRGIAQYTDDQLVTLGSNALNSCEPGVRDDYRRGPYSGRVQAWRNSFGDPAISAVSLSAAPEGRECVVVLHVVMIGEADVAAGQRILDTFEVDCGLISSDSPVAAGRQQPQYEEPKTFDPDAPELDVPDPDAQYVPPSGDIDCSTYGGPPIPVPPGSDGDGDRDGVACE